MSKKKQLSFNIFDHPCVQRVRAWAIIFDGTEAGKIVWAYPIYGAGIVKCQANVYSGPLNVEHVLRGTASGYDYCKTSASFVDALDRADITPNRSLHGAGVGETRRYLESLGYMVIEAV